MHAQKSMDAKQSHFCANNMFMQHSTYDTLFSTLTPCSHRFCHRIAHGTLPGSHHICSRVYSGYCCCIDKSDLYGTHTAARGRRLKGAKQEQRRRPSSLLPKLLKKLVLEIIMDRILRAVVMVVVKRSARFLFVLTNLSPV